MSVDVKVERNFCNCHPETCACNPWVLLVDGKKCSTYYRYEDAIETAKLISIIE